VYGPDVHAQAYFSDSKFPKNMPAIWNRHFGFVKTKGLGPAVCPGEWGGFCKDGSPDLVWQEAVAAWFRENDITDSFYWCLNPNSGDTGGVLGDDWVTPNDKKLSIIAAAHPNPTQWPKDPVTPVTPSPEECVVQGVSLMGTAGAAGKQQPAAAAAGGGGVGGGGAAAAASGQEIHSEGMLQVRSNHMLTMLQNCGTACMHQDIGTCTACAAGISIPTGRPHKRQRIQHLLFMTACVRQLLVRQCLPAFVPAAQGCFDATHSWSAAPPQETQPLRWGRSHLRTGCTYH
jgi:hypothetical protein